jgi:hypothetical protein
MTSEPIKDPLTDSDALVHLVLPDSPDRLGRPADPSRGSLSSS